LPSENQAAITICNVSALCGMVRPQGAAAGSCGASANKQVSESDPHVADAGAVSICTKKIGW